MSPDKAIKYAITAVVGLVLAVLIWVLVVPPYNVPKFENIENNQTGTKKPLTK